MTIDKEILCWLIMHTSAWVAGAQDILMSVAQIKCLIVSGALGNEQSLSVVVRSVVLEPWTAPQT